MTLVLKAQATGGGSLQLMVAQYLIVISIGADTGDDFERISKGYGSCTVGSRSIVDASIHSS